MGPTWGPPWDDRTHVGPMLATRILLSGSVIYLNFENAFDRSVESHSYLNSIYSSLSNTDDNSLACTIRRVEQPYCLPSTILSTQMLFSFPMSLCYVPAAVINGYAINCNLMVLIAGLRLPYGVILRYVIKSVVVMTPLNSLTSQ